MTPKACWTRTPIFPACRSTAAEISTPAPRTHGIGLPVGPYAVSRFQMRRDIPGLEGSSRHENGRRANSSKAVRIDKPFDAGERDVSATGRTGEH